MHSVYLCAPNFALVIGTVHLINIHKPMLGM